MRTLHTSARPVSRQGTIVFDPRVPATPRVSLRCVRYYDAKIRFRSTKTLCRAGSGVAHSGGYVLLVPCFWTVCIYAVTFRSVWDAHENQSVQLGTFSAISVFCVTVYAAYIHRQVKSPGYPSQKNEIRTNSVNCTTATGYATFHRTCGLQCRQKWRSARITLPQEPSRVAHSGLCTLGVCHGGISWLHQIWRRSEAGNGVVRTTELQLCRKRPAWILLVRTTSLNDVITEFRRDSRPS